MGEREKGRSTLLGSEDDGRAFLGRDEGKKPQWNGGWYPRRSISRGENKVLMELRAGMPVEGGLDVAVWQL